MNSLFVTIVCANQPTTLIIFGNTCVKHKRMHVFFTIIKTTYKNNIILVDAMEHKNVS
jgi:hypothetical protein